MLWCKNQLSLGHPFLAIKQLAPTIFNENLIMNANNYSFMKVQGDSEPTPIMHPVGPWLVCISLVEQTILKFLISYTEEKQN